jgi:hypothetical protein
MIKDIAKIIVFTLVGTLIVGGIISFVMWVYNNNTKYDELEYALEEIEDGVYGYYGVTVSSIPAQNYQMITVYYGGSMRTLKGDIQICYTSGEPKIYIKDYNIVNADDIIVYVPKGTIINTGTTGIGSRR